MKLWLVRIAAALGGALLLTFVLAIFYGIFQDRPFDWNPSFNIMSTQPYGSKVFFKELRPLFPKQKVRLLNQNDLNRYSVYVGDLDSLGLETFEKGVYPFGEDDYWWDLDYEKFNVFGLNRYFYTNEFELQLLSLHAARGNNVYISFLGCDELIEDYFGFSVYQVPWNELDSAKMHDLAIDFKGQSIRLDSVSAMSYFDTIPENAEVITTNKLGHPTCIEIKVAKGKIRFNLFPYAFSNYFILYQNHELAESEMKQLPLRDTYYFARLNLATGTRNESPDLLQFIHKHEALSWAFYLLLLSLIAFLAFQLKRVQRPVPVWEEKQNLNLSYIRSLSDLHLQKRDTRSVVKKKMDYLLHHFQKNYHINTHSINDDLAKKISVISGVPLADVKKLFIKYFALMAQSEPDENIFREFNRLIQQFKK